MKKRKIKNRKAQSIFGLSFSVIFSIFLIIFFIVIAFIAIKHFLGLKDCAQVGLFIEGLQGDIDTAWGSQKFVEERDYNIQGGLDYVCFANLSKVITGNSVEKEIAKEIGVYQHSGANLFFHPRENSCDMPYHKLKHINIEKITELRNPYCIEIEDGKIVINIEKEFNEGLVSLG